MQSIRFKTTRCFQRAEFFNKTPYIPVSKAAEWLGCSLGEVMAYMVQWKIDSEKSNACIPLHRHNKEFLFDPIRLFILIFHLRKKYPDHFMQICRVLVDFFEGYLKYKMTPAKRMKAFAQMFSSLEGDSKTRRRKMREFGYDHGVSLGTLYRWQKTIQTTGKLEPHLIEGAQARRRKECLPVYAQIFRLKELGFERKQIAEIMERSLCMVDRVVKEEQRYKNEIEKASIKAVLPDYLQFLENNAPSQTHGNGPSIGGCGFLAGSDHLEGI